MMTVIMDQGGDLHWLQCGLEPGEHVGIGGRKVMGSKLKTTDL